MSLKISKIDWGNDSAEKDPNLLNYFVNHPSLDRLLKRSKTFIIGRKGAGKSAIRKKVIEQFSKWSDNYIFEITPTFNIFNNIIADKDINEGFNKEVFFQYVWLNYLFKKALIEIGKKPKNKKLKEFKFAIELATGNQQAEKTLLDSAKDILNKIKVQAGKLGDLGVNIESSLRKEAEIEVYESNLKEIANAGYKITWIIDDLDLGWNNSEIANNLLLGLLTCTNYVKTLSTNFHIFICLREDVYRLLLTKTQHSDKYRDIEKISWSTNDLIELLESRIKYNYQVAGLDFHSGTFYSVFPETIGVSKVENWLSERTLQRPRELLQLSRLYSESNNTDIPDSEKLKNVELEYSNWKLEDVCTEFSNQYPNLLNVFNVWQTKFYRNKYHLKSDEFADIFLEIAVSANISSSWFVEIADNLDTKKLLEILYDIGCIGDFILGGAGGSKTCYSYKDVHIPMFKEFQVHPCFRKALGTVERLKN